MKFNWFEHASPGTKILLTFALMLSSLLIFSLIATLVAAPIFQRGINEILSASLNAQDPANLNILRYTQVVQSIALFVIPPFLLVYLFGSTPREYFKLKNIPSSNLWLLTALILIAFLPFISLTESVNSKINLPAALEGLENLMKSTEESAKIILEVFLNVNTIPALVFNIFMMAFIPAVGEELIFRGVLQKLFSDMFKNIHWGIIISAAVFSAIHMQFYGFIPRMLLGMMFGYLLVWSGSIWIPIFAHFLNNAMGVIYFYMSYNGKIDDRLEPFGTNVEVSTALISFIITAGLMYIFQKRASFNIRP